MESRKVRAMTLCRTDGGGVEAKAVNKTVKT